MGPVSSFIISLVSGQLFSDGIDVAVEKLRDYGQGKKLNDILDEYDMAFKKHHELEISQCNCDMELALTKRNFLITCAENHLSEDNSNLEKNLKERFISDACNEIGDDSNVVKTYLDNFYILIFANETKDIPVGQIALLNAYADSQNKINRKTDEEINNLIKNQSGKTEHINFEPYYQSVEERFTEEKENDIVGGESDEKAYLDAYINKYNNSFLVSSFLDNWFNEKSFGAILIYGEPGHGKTMLCNKAVVDFYRGKFLKGKANEVIAVSLNTGKNGRIIDGQSIVLSNALVWGPDNENSFSFDNCRGALLFLDGFDEFIDDAKRADAKIDNICSFMKRVYDIAKSYNIHIVVLSRTIAVFEYLSNLFGICEHYELSPLSEQQQLNWLNRHTEYADYKDAFKKLHKDKNMRKLLGVPLLFRLIVHSRFDTISTNVVELYNSLFIHLMNKRNIYGERIQLVEKDLKNLAFEIYCSDTYMAALENVSGDPHWLFTFYVETSKRGKIGFFHRTFYQYFLAKFIYSGMISLKDENGDKTIENKAEDFIGLFAERELDATVCKYLSLLLNNNEKTIIYANVEKLISALSRTEAYLGQKPHVDSLTAERSRIARSTNIYRNTLQIAKAFSYVISIPFKGNLDLIMRTFSSKGIVICSNKDKRANLVDANLSMADLNGADLSYVDLNGANLSGADLSGANLCGADLSEAKLSGANLSNAKLEGAFLIHSDLTDANLRKANMKNARMFNAKLYDADLREANLSQANLISDNFIEADLRKTILNGAFLKGADLRGARIGGTQFNNSDLECALIDADNKELIGHSAKGYDTIVWNGENAVLKKQDNNDSIELQREMETKHKSIWEELFLKLGL